jgi:hypothetical protein
MTPLRRFAPALALAATCFFATGCSESTGTVSGTITVNGKPLPAGLITFESQVGKHDAFSAAIKDGKYETAPIPAGDCKITVIHSTVAGPGGSGGGNDLAPPKPGAGGKTGPAIEVPSKYQRSDTSGLEFKVKSGPNTFDKDLT